MRRLCIVLVALLIPLAAGPGAAADTAPPADPLADLHQALFVTAHEVDAHLPHGDFTINDGVLGIFRGLSRRLSGVFIGDIDLEFNGLPSGEDVLDLFHEMQPDRRAIHLDVEAAYLATSMLSGAYVDPTGYATATRSWDDLEPDEQEHFEEIYLQSMSDGWVEEPASGAMGGHWAGGGGAAATPAVRLRDPVAKEVFTAIWTQDGERYDYRVDARGESVTITDYYRGISYFQHPWAPEEGGLDEALQYHEVHYSYNFTPPSGEGETRAPGRLEALVSTVFTITEPRQRLELVSYPWLEVQSITDLAGQPLAYTRGGEGASDWMLFVDGEFAPGRDYSLVFEFAADVPESYAGTGYAGVYRFDTASLWPGEAHPAAISIEVGLPGSGWSYVASNGAWVDAPPDESVATALWDASTRSQMIVATKFPMRELPVAWGNLEVYAPEELIESVEEMELVTAVGSIIEYYGGLWNDRGVLSQPVFLIPGETGVQAFEDAGLVFILGGTRTGLPLVAHEVAHLWWGQDASGPLWFTEGMANYGAAKFIEHYYGENGPGAGGGDPLYYRRYIINFSLGYELPLSFERRAEMEDTAAIYHNSAAFLLTADNRLPGGLDGILAQIHRAALNGPSFGHEELAGMFADLGGAALADLWQTYVEEGTIERSDVEDETYREFVLTPERENYVALLRWLTPAYKKMGIGDYAGALYCADRALEYRSEPKDFYFIANLTFLSGRSEEALERATALLENPQTDPATKVKATYLMSKIYREQGDEVSELASLEYVVAEGPAANAMFEVQAAQERLAELAGESD